MHYRWIKVQCHYVYLLGAAVDNDFMGDVAGVALDDVGWGLNGTIWSGEVLLFNVVVYGFKRFGSLKQLPITSERDTHKPPRIAVAYYTKREFELTEIVKLLGLDKYVNLIEPNLLTPYVLTRGGRYTPAFSTGRLLDMVALILEPDIGRTYEGEPAI